MQARDACRAHHLRSPSMRSKIPSHAHDYAIFDCDGVILQSNTLKTRAFEEALAGEPELLVRDFIAYHKKHGGVTRREKFRYFFLGLKGIDDEALIEKACDRFAEICERKLLEVPMVPGIASFLEGLTCRAAVVTGGNQEEVIRVLSRQGIAACFTEILGNPASKIENMRRLQMTGFFDGRGVYFGDSRLDYELACQFSQDFVFVSGYSEWKDISKEERDGFLAEIFNFEELSSMSKLG
jgi:phosphoglycolate phosphatase-like HAD superfamily hydrolase